MGETVERISAQDISTDHPRILEDCLDGRIFHISGFQQHVDIAGILNRVLRAGIREVAPSSDVAALAARGFQHLHCTLSAEEMAELTLAVDNGLTRCIPELTRKIVNMGAVHDQPLWVARRPFLRFHAPFSHSHAYTKRQQALKRRYGSVGFGGLGPHRDVWHSEPPQTVNLWSALGPVEKGNGLVMFPGAYTRSFEYVRRASITRNQRPGTGINFELAPGDALLFSGTQLHASELNITDQTRIVFGTRISLSDPHLTCSHPARFRKVLMHKPNSFRKLNELDRLAARIRYRLFPARGYAGYRHTHAGVAIRDVAREDFGGFRDIDEPAAPLDQLPLDTLQAQSAGEMVVRLAGAAGTEAWRLDRACPHCGSDLSLGRCEDGKVICPWHNLPIDIRSGQSPCPEIPALSSTRLA